MNIETQLVHFDRARQELALARNIDEVKLIRDQAEAIRAYIKQQKGSFEMQNTAAEIKLRAERRAGEMLKKTEFNKGAQGLIQQHLTGSPIMEPPVELPKLADLGITKTQSYRWQLEAEIPEEKFEQFIAETKAVADELTSKAVLGIAQKMKREAEPKTVELPAGQFNVIYSDVPWKYDNSIESWGPASLHYQSLPVEQIAYYQDPHGVRVQDKFASDSVLFLWVTNPFVRDAFEVVDAWGFSYKTNIVWVKTELQRPGSGFYVRGRHELLFICTKGSFVPDQTGKEPIGSVVEAPIQEHSQKPDVVYEIIERMYPEGKYLELFARKERHGWTSWGNEIETTIT